jgi:hypothetical protein
LPEKGQELKERHVQGRQDLRKCAVRARLGRQGLRERLGFRLRSYKSVPKKGQDLRERAGQGRQGHSAPPGVRWFKQGSVV